MHHVYILESIDTGKRYIGYTTDVYRRLAEHNAHKNVSTSREREWRLIYYESYLQKLDA